MSHPLKMACVILISLKCQAKRTRSVESKSSAATGHETTPFSSAEASKTQLVDPNNAAESYYTPQPILRVLANITTSVQFALALQLSGLTDPLRVLSFLLLPFHKAFDPSLAFLAAGALPLGTILWHFARGNEVPVLGGKWSIPKPCAVDMKLAGGAAIFGVGWGMAGICRESELLPQPVKH